MSVRYIILCLLISPLLVGACGSSAQLRAQYASEVARCTQNERHIVARDDSTAEQDDADLAVERARCDAALVTIDNGGE